MSLGACYYRTHDSLLGSTVRANCSHPYGERIALGLYRRTISAERHTDAKGKKPRKDDAILMQKQSSVLWI